MARSKKITWPIGFEDMIRFAYAKKRPEDRLKFYRLFLRDFLHSGSTIQASEEEIESALAAESFKQRAKIMADGRWLPKRKKV